MRISSVYWTPQVNMLRIKCSCGRTFDHRSDRWKVRCPSCPQHAALGKLRDYYLKEGFATMKVTMYTDGACSGNPGPAGWAAILQCGEHEREVVGGAVESTNNRAEVMAVIVGLQALKGSCQVTVITDSQYVIGVLSLGWKRKVNHDVLSQADVLLAEHDVTFVKVKGHNGNVMNKRCDQAAGAEAERQRSILGASMVYVPEDRSDDNRYDWDTDEEKNRRSADFTGTSCVGCGDLARNGFFCSQCEDILSPEEKTELWAKYCQEVA